MPTPSSPSVVRCLSASPSPSAGTPACGISSRPYPRRTGRRSPRILTLAMEPTTADRPLTPTVKIYRDNRSSMSLVPRFAAATTPFGGFGLKFETIPATRAIIRAVLSSTGPSHWYGAPLQTGRRNCMSGMTTRSGRSWDNLCNELAMRSPPEDCAHLVHKSGNPRGRCPRNSDGNNQLQPANR